MIKPYRVQRLVGGSWSTASTHEDYQVALAQMNILHERANRTVRVLHPDGDTMATVWSTREDDPQVRGRTAR